MYRCPYCGRSEEVPLKQRIVETVIGYVVATALFVAAFIYVGVATWDNSVTAYSGRDATEDAP